MPKNKNKKIQEQPVLCILAADGPLSNWLSMEKEHVLAWLICHAKLPQFWIQSFSLLHINIISASNKSSMSGKWQSMWHTAPHAGISKEWSSCQWSNLLYCLGIGPFPWRYLELHCTKNHCILKDTMFSKRVEWVISPFLQFCFCALFFLAGMWATSTEGGDEVLFPKQKYFPKFSLGRLYFHVVANGIHFPCFLPTTISRVGFIVKALKCKTLCFLTALPKAFWMTLKSNLSSVFQLQMMVHAYYFH